jgi:hypothetical protein
MVAVPVPGCTEFMLCYLHASTKVQIYFTSYNMKTKFESHPFITEDKCISIAAIIRARGSVAGSGTMLQAIRSRVRFPVRLLNFSLYLTHPAALWP